METSADTRLDNSVCGVLDALPSQLRLTGRALLSSQFLIPFRSLQFHCKREPNQNQAFWIRSL